MLERQHTQLIAGLQELYRRTQYGQGGNGARSEPINNGQPLTHNILEGLGVLQQDEWDDSEGPDGSTWQNFEQHANDIASSYLSSAASPATQAAFSPRSLTTSFSPFGKTRFPYTTADSAYSMPAPMAPFDLIESNIDFNIQSRILNTDMDWPYGTDDMFDNLASQGIPLQVDAS